MLCFKKNYFIIALLLFAIEVVIARYVHDQIIRPFVGDLLVVILIYATYRTFIRNTVFRATLQVLLFAFAVEFIQLLPIIDYLGIDKKSILAIVIGSTFDFHDLIAYLSGGFLILLIEWRSR